VKDKIGRNDPCFCGSGLKYKKCHGTTLKSPLPWAGGGFFKMEVEEIKKPSAKVMIFKKGKWEEVPRVQPLLSLTYSDDRYKNEDIEKLSTKIQAKLITGKFSNNNVEIQNPLTEVKHKLYAVNYHLKELIEEETANKETILREKIIPDGPYMEQRNDKMVYELEALLFQTKACLDRIARLLNPCLEFKLKSFGTKKGNVGGKVLAKLLNNCPNQFKDLASELAILIEQNVSDWIEEVVEYRDTITHYRQLQGFLCFVHEPTTGEKSIKVYYPVMPNKARMTDYAKLTFDKIMLFTENFITKLFD